MDTASLIFRSPRTCSKYKQILVTVCRQRDSHSRATQPTKLNCMVVQSYISVARGEPSCSKHKDTPAKCALLDDLHTAVMITITFKPRDA